MRYIGGKTLWAFKKTYAQNVSHKSSRTMNLSKQRRETNRRNSTLIIFGGNFYEKIVGINA